MILLESSVEDRSLISNENEFRFSIRFSILDSREDRVETVNLLLRGSVV